MDVFEILRFALDDKNRLSFVEKPDDKPTVM